jgi:midasin (ATPase involved in ribosome maturation)
MEASSGVVERERSFSCRKDTGQGGRAGKVSRKLNVFSLTHHLYIRTGRPEDLSKETPRKRRKTEHAETKPSQSAWTDLLREVEEFEVQHVHGKGKFAFGFVEGPLVKALRSGDWSVTTPFYFCRFLHLVQGPFG